MLMQWGQFIDHDITSTPVTRGRNNTVLDCSSCDSALVNRACDPIPIPPEDEFFPQTSGRRGEKACIPFARYFTRLASEVSES
jgi:peroxidase